ncbi:unnamed protein product [Brassica oleracea]
MDEQCLVLRETGCVEMEVNEILSFRSIGWVVWCRCTRVLVARNLKEMCSVSLEWMKRGSVLR